MAEIMSVLFFNTMKYSIEAPKDASSDRFILSKGHAAPILYAGMYNKKISIFIKFKVYHKIQENLLIRDSIKFYKYIKIKTFAN